MDIVWDRRCLNANGKPVGVLTGHLEGITFIDTRGDGRYLISNGKDQAIKLWDIRGQLVMVLDLPTGGDDDDDCGVVGGANRADRSR
ncbi:hypothetical protein G4B88_019313 [Cannabis sativa]|uniref:Uncharacterized protein n=1 Tax=Cannabis sativa TaxID=3483 RepID=A0A7J6DKG6_CANSA|nr:hypothetical protein G4B88_019313 [Cannabis sativa]